MNKPPFAQLKSTPNQTILFKMSTEEQSPFDRIQAILDPLPMEDKLIFLATFTKQLKKEARKNLKRSARKTNTSTSTRKLPIATYAWLAYKNEVKKNNPELLQGITHPIEQNKIVSKYKKEHQEEYDAFAKKYKEDYEAGTIELPVSKKKQQLAAKEAASSTESKSNVVTKVAASSASSVVEELPPPVTQTVGKEKLEQMKKKMAEKAISVSAETEAKAPLPKEEEKPKEEKKKKSVVKKVTAAAPAATSAAEPSEGEEFITVDGKEYIMLTETKGCFQRNANNTFGAWVGYYDSKTKKITKTESPSK